jgi:hypothetical protein
MSGPRAPHSLRHEPQSTPLKFEEPLMADTIFVETKRGRPRRRGPCHLCEHDRAQIAKLATKTRLPRRKRRLLNVEHAVGDTKHVFSVEFVFHCANDVGVGCG